MFEARRDFLRYAVATAAFGYAMLRDDAIERVRAAVRDAGDASPDELAGDEDFWFQVQRAYDVDRSIINLNNGGVAPAPRSVMDAMRRHLAFTNHQPSRHLWQVLDPQVETVRARIAKVFGCDPEEIAITRNASEGLEICLYGLDLKRGDEVLSTSHDYPRMINTLKQRELREGIVLKTFDIPTPPKRMSELVELFERGQELVGDRTLADDESPHVAQARLELWQGLDAPSVAQQARHLQIHLFGRLGRIDRPAGPFERLRLGGVVQEVPISFVLELRDSFLR